MSSFGQAHFLCRDCLARIGCAFIAQMAQDLERAESARSKHRAAEERTILR